MPVYEYKALNDKGRKVKGIITADGLSGARLRLSQGAVFPTEVRELPGEEKRGKASRSFFAHLWGVGRAGSAEVTTALRQLATLVSSGLTIVECLSGLIEQTECHYLRRVFTQIREKVMEGHSLSQSVAAHSQVFTPIHVNLIRAGETSGRLGIILKRLADFSEKRMKLRKKMEAAIAYPMFLLLVSTVIVIFLMSFVMPRVISIFEGMDLVLPWTTRALIFMTLYMKQYWWLILLAIAGTMGTLIAWVKTEAGARSWDRIRLRAPLFGNLHLKSVVARFTRTLSLLLNSGIPLVESLEIARLSMGNRVMEEAVAETAISVVEGRDFAVTLKTSGLFPSLLVQLVKAGEQSGELTEMLEKSAEIYEEDVNSMIASLISLLEPAVILGTGVMVGFLVMAIMLPVLEMSAGAM